VTGELALRAIIQYESTTSDERHTRVPSGRRLDTDCLVSYVLNPWTAVYAGYNNNDRDAGPDVKVLLRDSQQFFVKASYLYRC
jgi:predicted porin